MIDKGVRKEIFGLINKLKQRTVNNGCTENEAEIAMNQLNSLLKKYNLTMTEADVFESKITQLDIEVDKESVMQFACYGLSYYTNTQIWKNSFGRKTYSYSILGLKHDVEIAEYLWDLLGSAIRFSLVKFEISNLGASVKEKRSFTVGMASRLSSRLKEMKDQEQKESGQQWGLVVQSKEARLMNLLREMGIKFSYVKNNSKYDADALKKGRKEADNVEIHKGVTNNPNSIKQLN